MKKILSWMVDNHVAANLLMILILFLGILSLKSVNIEIFPEVSNDVIQVSVSYPGASPDEVEESICIPIEEAIKGIEGIDRITATANENVGVVNAELELGEDLSEIKEKIQTEVDRITTFPEESEKPIITEAIQKNEVIQVAVYGEAEEKTLKHLIEKVKDDLLDNELISQINTIGVREYEVSIEISEEKLQMYQLTLEKVTNAIRLGSLDLPGGKIKTKGEEILLRSKSLAYNKKEYENIILFSDYNGQTIKIKDIATVVDGFEDNDLYTYFNGQSVAMLGVYRTGSESALDIAREVKNYIKKMKEVLPKQIKIDTWYDQSRILQSRIDLLLTNAAQGAILVILCLAFFLEIRLAMWVVVGIFISFIGTFFFMDGLDASINMISLFAFILVIGIVVDDAVVVGENIFTFREAKYTPEKAAKKGVAQVITPIIFSVSTTIAAFAPLLFVDGFMGKFMRVIPIIVISVLLLSLIESLFILPVHLANVRLKPKFRFIQWFDGINNKIHKWLDKVIEEKYTPFLKKALKYKNLTIAVSIFALFFSIGLIGIGAVKFVFFPEVEADNMIVRITMPEGTSIEKTEEIVKKIEKAALKTQEKFDKEYKSETSVFRNIYSAIGDQPMLRRSGGSPTAVVVYRSNIAEINVELLPSEEREATASQMLDTWREYVGKLPGVETLTFESNLISAGNDVEVAFSDKNLDDLLTAIDLIKKKLSHYAGVTDIRDDFQEGKIEYKFKLKESAATLGLTEASLAFQVRAAFYGDEALKIQRGKDEVKVMVRYPKEERISIENINDLRIRTPSGVEVPFSSVAKVEVGNGYSVIKRNNFRSVVSLIADVQEDVVTAGEINQKIQTEIIPEFQKKFPHLRYSYEGGQREQNKAIESLQRDFMVALFLIYALLAIPFRSYIQPLVVMLSIPFGLIGAVFGHLLLGLDISLMSMFGLVALAGIVVNSSLVLVDFINTHKNEKKQSIKEGIILACQKRFRPILLTSLTTFLGLMPIMFETSTQAEFLKPMAISLGFGVLFSTMICLLLVPVCIMMMEQFAERRKKRKKKRENLSQRIKGKMI